MRQKVKKEFRSKKSSHVNDVFLAAKDLCECDIFQFTSLYSGLRTLAQCQSNDAVYSEAQKIVPQNKRL